MKDAVVNLLDYRQQQNTILKQLIGPMGDLHSRWIIEGRHADPKAFREAIAKMAKRVLPDGWTFLKAQVEPFSFVCRVWVDLKDGPVKADVRFTMGKKEFACTVVKMKQS